MRKTTLREVKLLRMLRHPNIVSLKEAFRRKGKLYLVFEFVSKNLLEVLENEVGGVGSDATCRYMLQLAQAIDCCHSHSVIHRDIKPENLLVRIPASRGAAVPSRHRRDSCPSHDDVGGLWSKFEPFRTASSDRDRAGGPAGQAAQAVRLWLCTVVSTGSFRFERLCRYKMVQSTRVTSRIDRL